MRTIIYGGEMKRIALILACGVFILVSIQALMYHQALLEASEAQARVTEISVRTARVREYEFLRGVYAFCLASYKDPMGCNQIVREAVEYKVYSDPSFSFGFEPPQ